jgi:hypothetical protein
VDDFGQLTGFPGVAAGFAEDAPGLELSVGAQRVLAGWHECVGGFWEAGLFLRR